MRAQARTSSDLLTARSFSTSLAALCAVPDPARPLSARPLSERVSSPVRIDCGSAYRVQVRRETIERYEQALADVPISDRSLSRAEVSRTAAVCHRAAPPAPVRDSQHQGARRDVVQGERAKIAATSRSNAEMVQVPPPPSPTSHERLLGTLIVIVLRAKNLPNRVRIGKQNPYCTITYGLHKKRTDTIERGGQQPEWDAEFRFEILKEGLGGEEQLAADAAIVTHKGGVLPAPGLAPAMVSSTSQGSDVSATGVKVEKRLSKHSLSTPVVSTCAAGKRVLKVACWADDARDPKLIGEGELDIEETIRKGKYDGVFRLPLRVRTKSISPRQIPIPRRLGPARAQGAVCGRGLPGAHMVFERE